MGAVMARYSIYVRADLLQLFWAGMQAGDFIIDSVVPINASRRTGAGSWPGPGVSGLPN
jgi:hypothetical protein